MLAGLARTRLRTAGKAADLSMALTGRFTAHHALMCRRHLDRITISGQAVAGLDTTIAPLVARYPDAAALLGSLPWFGDVIVAGWLGAIGPAPHRWFATAGKLACWAAICPGNYMSARKRRAAGPGTAGPTSSRCGPKSKGAKKRAITAIAHTLLKIACQVRGRLTTAAARPRSRPPSRHPPRRPSPHHRPGSAAAHP